MNGTYDYTSERIVLEIRFKNSFKISQNYAYFKLLVSTKMYRYLILNYYLKKKIGFSSHNMFTTLSPDLMAGTDIKSLHFHSFYL